MDWDTAARFGKLAKYIDNDRTFLEYPEYNWDTHDERVDIMNERKAELEARFGGNVEIYFLSYGLVNTPNNPRLVSLSGFAFLVEFSNSDAAMHYKLMQER